MIKTRKSNIKRGPLLNQEVKLELNSLNNLEFITSCYHMKFSLYGYLSLKLQLPCSYRPKKKSAGDCRWLNAPLRK